MQAQQIKDDLMRAVDRDTEAFNDIIAAMRLPKDTPEQKVARKTAIETGYQAATEVPLMSARLCLRSLELCRKVAQKGLPAGITDAGVGALLARAGLEGSIYNVRINLAEVADHAWVEKVNKEVHDLRLQGAALADESAHLVEKQFALNAEVS